MYKYFTWTDSEGYFKGNSLLSIGQIEKLKTSISSRAEVFETIQDYDNNGKCIGCRVYFDIDSPSLYDAYESMTWVTDRLSDNDIEFNVWFSGSKGFHIITSQYVRHPRCHEIVKAIAEDYKCEDIDTSVYRTRAMLRCDSTWNKKGGVNKVMIRESMTLEDILSISSGVGLNIVGAVDIDIDSYVEKLPSYNDVIKNIDGDFMDMFMPCMKTIWAMDSPDEGERHHIAHIFARHCFRSGLSSDEAQAFFSSHAFWKEVRRGEGHWPSKIISSVYRTGKAMVGCKGGRDGEILQQYCDKLCRYSADFGVRDVFRGSDD